MKTSIPYRIVVFLALLIFYPLSVVIHTVRNFYWDFYWLIPILEGEKFWTTALKRVDFDIKRYEDLRWKINKFFA